MSAHGGGTYSEWKTLFSGMVFKQKSFSLVQLPPKDHSTGNLAQYNLNYFDKPELFREEQREDQGAGV